MDLRFSILVPTRQRPDTLPATLATLVEQHGDDYEIVVADNCGDAEVDQVIKAAQMKNPRVKHIRSEQVLPMAVNWERGLAACTGEYVSVLGDDDGFLPSTIEIVRYLVSAKNPRVIAWGVHTYWWPDTIAYWHRNRLYVPLASNELFWKESRPVLVETFRHVTSFSHLPTIYNGFVHRDVINTVIGRFGGYFVPPDMSPDVSSGILNLAHTGRYLYSPRPLAVRGNSKRSTGTAHWARALGKAQRDTYMNEEGKTLEQLMHPTLNASLNLGFLIANTKLHLKDLIFPHDKELQIDFRALVQHTIDTLNDQPDAYADNLADALELAKRIGFAIDPTTVPPKMTRQPKPGQGTFKIPGADMAIGINCDMVNIFDVAGAARLAEAMSSGYFAQDARTATDVVPMRKAG